MVTASPPTNITITLPPLHKGRGGLGGQQELEDSGARFQVVVCGRRWGKTTYGVRKCMKGAVETGGIYWWIAPTYAVASIGWRMLKKLAIQIPGTEIREADRCVIIPNSGQIWCKSADNPEGLRGEKLDGAVFDEAAQIKPDSWFESVRPALSDNRGWALFIGTPKGKNWLYQLYKRAETKEHWAAFKKPTSDNPYIDLEEIEQARQEMSDEQFKQEYEADFGASQFLVFPTFDRAIHEWRGDLPPFVKWHGGLDFGGTSIDSHKSTGVVVGLTAKDELIFTAEFEQSGPQVGERQLEWMAHQLVEVRNHAKLHKRPPTGIRWRADKSQMWGIQLVRQMGYNIVQSKGGKDSIQMGIELIQRRLKVREDRKPRLYYKAGLKFIPEAFERYRYPDYPEGDEEHLRSKVPISVNDDTMAAVRYCVEDVDFGVHGDPSKLYQRLLGKVR